MASLSVGAAAPRAGRRSGALRMVGEDAPGAVTWFPSSPAFCESMEKLRMPRMLVAIIVTLEAPAHACSGLVSVEHGREWRVY